MIRWVSEMLVMALKSQGIITLTFERGIALLLSSSVKYGSVMSVLGTSIVIVKQNIHMYKYITQVTPYYTKCLLLMTKLKLIVRITRVKI